MNNNENNNNIFQDIQKEINENRVVLFMKGTPNFPQCGFSSTVVQILSFLNVPFKAIDVLSNQTIREKVKEFSNWPTIPQLYIDGEFIGGCDITKELYRSGELKSLLEKKGLIN